MIAALLLAQAVVAVSPVDIAAVEQAQADARAATRAAASAKAVADAAAAAAAAAASTSSATATIMSTVATKAELATVSSTASTAQQMAAAAPTKADLAALSATIPLPAATVPPSEMLGGKPGTAGTYRPADAAQPRITRAAVVTTGAAGAWTITWSSALPADPVTLPIPVNSTAEPVVCNVITTTLTGASGRCWYARALPATISLVSALVNFDVFGASAVGIPVQILAIPKTQ